MSKLSDWFTGIPPAQGWWNTRIKGCNTHLPANLRRHWNGVKWSGPVTIGKTSDKECGYAMNSRSTINPQLIEYQGLLSEPLEPVHPTH